MDSVPVVWVTGASKGIGAALARAFAEMGARVILSGRKRPALRRQVESISRLGGTAKELICEVSSEKSVRRTYEIIAERFGPVDVLVNNAGVTFFKSFASTTSREFDRIIDTNLRGYYLCTKAVLPSMVKKKSGWIINIQSVSAVTTFLDSSVYAASKAGALAMSRGLRAEVRKKGIRVIDILPGAVETEMWSRSDRRRFHSKMMQPEDVADVVVSLYCQPKRVLTEEIIIRPVKGDLE